MTTTVQDAITSYQEAKIAFDKATAEAQSRTLNIFRRKTMDPLATTRSLISALLGGDHQEVIDMTEYLNEWLVKGGYLPTQTEMFEVIQTEMSYAAIRQLDLEINS